MNKKYEIFKENPNDTLYRIRALRSFSDVKKGDIGGFIEKESNLSHDGNCWLYNKTEVYDNAKVFDYAKIYDDSHVYGYAQVYNNAKIYGKAKVYGASNIYGLAKVYGNSQVYGDAEVYGHAKVCGHATVCGNAQVYDNARIFDNAKVYSYAKVYGNADIAGHARVYRGEITDKVIYMNLPKHNLTVQGDGYVMIGCECHSIDYWVSNYEEIGKENNYSTDDIDLYGSVLKMLKPIIIKKETTK